MQIKQIELKGFKSFKQKTIIRFGEGVNCIVGPNGCGKSNILDAFMWVMGETAPSHLRGDSMEDVIFTGTGQQPPSGLAEVSLVLEKTKHRFLPAPYRNFSEIMLTRRLDRDGKSEYLLNSQMCRLKDIQDVFMDTGSGVHGFSFIEQGAVEQFISSKPEQKRRLIETAAGISRFRIKKKEAERKLSLTSVNLQRLEDLLSDQENQLKKLKKQSEKAEQFKDLKSEIQEKDLQISHWDLEMYESKNKKLNQSLQEDCKKADRTKSRLTEFNSALEQLKKDYENKKQELQSAESKLTIYRQEAQVLEKTLAGLSSSLQAWSDNKTFFQKDAESSQQNKSKTLQLLTDNKKNLENIERKKVSLLEQQNRLKKQCLHQEKRCYDLELQSDLLAKKLLDFKQRDSLAGELNKSVEQNISELVQSEKEYQGLLDKKWQEQQKLNAKKINLQEQLEKEKQLSFNVSQQVEKLTEELEQLKGDIAHKEKDFQEARHQASVFYAEGESLKKWSARMDATDKGLQFVLKNENGGQFIGTADAISLSSPDLEEAVSSFMEFRLKSLLCDKKSARAVASSLTKEKVGRCRFIIKDFQQTPVVSREELQGIKKAEGFKYFLTDQLKGNQELIEWLFNRTAVVDNLDSAMKLKAKYPSWCFISLTGEVLTSEGDLIAGQGEINILEYRRAMKEIPLQYQSWRGKKSILNDELKNMKNICQQKSEKLTELSKKQGGGEVFVFGMKKDMELVNRDLVRLESDIMELQQKIQDCQKKIQGFQGKKKTLGSIGSVQQTSLEQELEKIKRERDEESEKKELLLGEKKQVDQKVSDYEIEQQSIKIKQEWFSQSLEQEQHREQSLFMRSQEKQKQIEKDEKELSFKEVQRKQALEKMEKQTEKVKLLVTACEQTQKEVDKKQTDIIQLHEDLSEVESHINEMKLEQENISSKKSALLARIHELYQVELDNKNYVAKSDRPVEFNREKMEGELEQMNMRLSRMGAMNLLALEEREELLKENQFYQNQYEDLSSSRDKLLEAITKIDRFCSEKFKTVFEQINTCFAKIFPALFEGGKAELKIIESNDGEEGIDIMVQPPGKKLQNMNLLSGGEKAMTAVSVIFSIFMVKPSPFCILDEVDAPLDDVNIARFNSLLTEMSNISQVLIITHNKYTMKNSHRLYGVTMEEKGISKVMSLDMKSVVDAQSSQSEFI